MDNSKGEQSAAELRNALKIWEKTFAAAHGGRKPKRVDIQNDATISAKYREYDRLYRKPLPPKHTPQKTHTKEQSETHREVLKDRSTNIAAATPQKRSRGLAHDEIVRLEDTQEEEPTPACIRFALGPTPQKDGEVLGIFDLLPGATPSKSVSRSDGPAAPAILGTPSKSPALASSDPKLSRTPQSSGKRHYLDAFAGTPLKHKQDIDGFTPSTARRSYSTPVFLRRATVPLARIEEDDDDCAAAPPPFKKRSFVRSLSSIIQGLRKQEEQKMDEDWEIMKELEAGEGGASADKTQPSVPKVLVEASQAVDMPLGPDHGAVSSDEESDKETGGLDANGKPRKVWKKKGLKRQTRRIIMRPVLHRPQKAENVHVSREDESVAVADDDATFASDATDDDEEPLGQEEGRGKTRESKKAVSGTKDNASKPVKKVNAQAHMNFRRLKIKNKNAKANGRGRKFGKR